MKKVIKLEKSSITMLWLLVAIQWTGFSQTTNHKTQSVLIYSIAKMSQWPNAPQAEFKIIVLGNSGLYNEMLANIEGRPVGSAKVKVTSIENISEIGTVNILVLPESKSGLLEQLQKATAGKSIMIVAEREGLFKNGAGVSFITTAEGKVRFEINETDLNKRSIKISKQLTSLASSVI